MKKALILSVLTLTLMLNSHAQESHCTTVDLGDNVKVEIRGTHCDLIWFYVGNAKIHEENIRDGDNLTAADISFRRISSNKIVVAVRHGRLRDVCYGYAIINGEVIRSPRWRDVRPGDNGQFAITWTGSTIIGIDGRGILIFDESKKTWQCVPNQDGACE